MKFPILKEGEVSEISYQQSGTGQRTSCELCPKSAAKDIYRKEKRFRHIPWEDVEAQYNFPVQEITESLTDVEKAILKLPLAYRQIFQMKFAWGYPNKEIAEVLNIREGTLRQRVSRGKEILRNLLKEMEVYVDE